MKQKRDREEACPTCGHYHDYEGGEPCGVCGHVMAPAGARGHDSCLPSAVLDGWLFLGSYDTAARQELLKVFGITYILNTVPTCPELYRNTFTYHTVQQAPPDFDECFGFLDAARAQQRKALVYCMSGSSRSPAVVVAYLMRVRGWRLAESYKWVKHKRPQTAISEADTKRLQELELRMYGSCSAPTGFAFMSLPALSPSAHEQQQLEQSTEHQQQQEQEQQEQLQQQQQGTHGPRLQQAKAGMSQRQGAPVTFVQQQPPWLSESERSPAGFIFGATGETVSAAPPVADSDMEG